MDVAVTVSADILLRIAAVEMTYPTRDGGFVHALSDIHLDIKNGEFVSIVGPSGCGKSSLLKILAGILPRSGGEIDLRGQKLRGPSREVGMVFQAPVLLPWLTVLENVMVPLRIQRQSRRAGQARA